MSRRITDAERRARLVARHYLAGDAPDVVAAVRGVAALHSSDPLTPYLAARARVAGFRTADLDRALCEERTLWRLHAMRRTLFVVPTDEAAFFLAGASREVADRERRRVERWLAAEMEGESVSEWLARVEADVLDVLRGGGEWRTSELAEAVPELRTEITVGSGKWSTRTRLTSRVLFLMAMDGRIVRTRPAGSWRSSQYGWAAATEWFGAMPDELEPKAGRAGIARRYLAGHGPATLTDLRWWTGWTAKRARASLEACGAISVELDGGRTGFVLPDEARAPSTDTPPPGTEAHAAPTVAFLPGLDPTPMGWKERDWYLGAHADRLFDRNGNAGPTIWVNGRVVGGWAQRPGGQVVHRLLEDVEPEAAARVGEEAEFLAEWLDGTVVTPRFRAPLERELSGGG